MMETKRVVITGVGAVCAFGRKWSEIEAAFRAGKNAVRRMEAWDAFPEMETRLGAPLPAYHWWIVIGFTLAGLILALFAMRQWRYRVSYWV